MESSWNGADDDEAPRLPARTLSLGEKTVMRLSSLASYISSVNT